MGENLLYFVDKGRLEYFLDYKSTTKKNSSKDDENHKLIALKRHECFGHF
jgi:hypothetical protein